MGFNVRLIRLLQGGTFIEVPAGTVVSSTLYYRVG